MSCRTVAIALGVACLPACGDSTHALTDASTNSGPHVDAQPHDAPQPDAPVDAFVRLAPILQYDFEESTTMVADSSGRGMDGTLSDVAAWTANGRTGRGLALSAPNGVAATQFVSLPSGVLTSVDDFTISTWINLNSITIWARIYDIGNGKAPPDDHFMFMTLLGNTPGTATPPNAFDGLHTTSFPGTGGSAEIFLGTKTQLPIGVWKHIALTGSGGDRTLYIDGFPAASISGGATVPPSQMEPLAGNSWLGKSRFPDAGLDGTLDEFRIYNRVLKAPEIADLAWPQHDYSYWRFDENSGLTAKNSSDNLVSAVLANGVTWTTGRLGGAIDIPGGAPSTTGPQVEFTSSPLTSCTTQLTIAAWIKMHALSNWSRIFDFGSARSAFIYLVPTDGAGMHFAMVSPNGIFDMVTASPPVAADDTWHHVAVTVDPTALVTIYVDGASVKTQTNTTAVKPQDFAATTENWLGKSRFTDTDPYLNGSIDELRISCRAYTADEIKNLAHPAAP